MNLNEGPEEAVVRDGHAWDANEPLDAEPVGLTDRSESDESASDGEEAVAGVAVDVDLDDLDAPIGPEFEMGEAWEFEPLDLDDDDHGDDDDEVRGDESDDDEAEMCLLHELGIDLDAPDEAPGPDLTMVIDHDQDESADDGVAA
jgi:hypothetical protein